MDPLKEKTCSEFYQLVSLLFVKKLKKITDYFYIACIKHFNINLAILDDI